MSTEENIATIEAIYDAFGRGDVAGIVARVTDDVDWASEAAGKAAPWYGPHHGPDGVSEFFARFGGSMEVETFTPEVIAATGDDVLTVVRFAASGRASGTRVAMHLHHHFRFRDGKVAHYRGTEDTAQTEAVFRT